MQCQQAQELFSDHVADRLDAALTLSLENHIRSCETCRAEVGGLRQVWSSLDALPVVEPPSFFHENLMHRIAMERDKAAEEAQRHARWSWRALFQPRSPVFAAALLAVALVAGMGELHVQHGALDPLGAILHMARGAQSAEASPALLTARAEWHPNGQGAGTLTLYAQAPPGHAVRIEALNYRSADAKPAVVAHAATVSAEQMTTVSIPLPSRPISDLTLTVSAQDGPKATLPVTLMEPVSPPAAER